MLRCEAGVLVLSSIVATSPTRDEKEDGDCDGELNSATYSQMCCDDGDNCIKRVRNERDHRFIHNLPVAGQRQGRSDEVDPGLTLSWFIIFFIFPHNID